MVTGLLWLTALAFVGLACRAGVRATRAGTRAKAGAGTMYDWMTRDQQKAIEIIVDGQAEVTDPETADGRPRAGRSSRAGRSGRARRTGRSGGSGRAPRA